MEDYARAVIDAVEHVPRPTALLGWSLGGLAVLMAANHVGPSAVVLLEASPPAEVQGVDFGVELEEGNFDPEAIYGSFPPGMASRPDSKQARSERKRGISVPSLPCQSLVVFGREFAEERGRRLATFYGSDTLPFVDLDHWHLVLDERVRSAVAEWLVSRGST
jgi:pimeloyl-ACP methyl ester carboxylesterase